MEIKIGNATVTVHGHHYDGEGRMVFQYTIKGDGLDHSGLDLKSGVGVSMEDADGMESLLSFLTAAAESYRYAMTTGRDGENSDLFPSEVVEWAYQHADELFVAEYELSEPSVPAGYEVFHDNDMVDEDGNLMPAGWYWWSCQPGCLPDGDPMGPFPTEKEAIRDCRDGLGG